MSDFEMPDFDLSGKKEYDYTGKWKVGEWQDVKELDNDRSIPSNKRRRIVTVEVSEIATDAEMLALADMGMGYRKIAKITEQDLDTVLERMKKIKKGISSYAPNVVRAADKSVFNLQDCLETLYQDLHLELEQLDNLRNSDSKFNLDQTRLGYYREVRETLRLAKDVLETIYSVQRIETFMENVLKELDEAIPEARTRVLKALQSRRVTGLAFRESGSTIPAGATP